MLSRDGRWLAYASDETGRYEIYVRPFPDVNGGKWQVSRNGGFEAFWSHNGRELFYRDPARNIVAVAVLPGATFSVGEQRTLFSTQGLRVLLTGSYDVMPDDSRFLFTRVVGGEGDDSVRPVVLVENWGAELRKGTQRR